MSKKADGAELFFKDNRKLLAKKMTEAVGASVIFLSPLRSYLHLSTNDYAVENKKEHSAFGTLLLRNRMQVQGRV